MNTMTLRFVGGHRIEQRTYAFPHLCPGEGCAISEWIKGKIARRTYESGVHEADPRTVDVSERG